MTAKPMSNRFSKGPEFYRSLRRGSRDAQFRFHLSLPLGIKGVKPSELIRRLKLRRRAALVAYWSDPTKRAAHGELTRQRMDRAEVRRRISEGTAAAHNVPGMRERKLAGLARAFADPELRRRISVATKAGMAARAEREFAVLKTAWDAAPTVVRRRFLVEVAAPTSAIKSSPGRID